MVERDKTAVCPDCGVVLPAFDGPTHRYLGASAACWAQCTKLLNGKKPPLASAPHNLLLVDAYAAQHPGQPSPQAIQSVAVHLLVLYGVFERGVAYTNGMWIRRRPLRNGRLPKHSRFHWLIPPPLNQSLTINDIVTAPTPAQRSEVAKQYIEGVWAAWAAQEIHTLATWYDQFVVPDKI